MVELQADALIFSFPELHPGIQLRVTFERMLRVPDDGGTYPLPQELGVFPLRHVDDYRESVPDDWITHGGVMLPMHQSEALRINFEGEPYWFAVKVAAGKRNVVTGEAWGVGLSQRGQNYLVVPDQPWIGGFCFEKGRVRQFVAMPLGAGRTVEEQLCGGTYDSLYGGIQIEVFPMKMSAIECARKRDSLKPLEDCALGVAPGGRMWEGVYKDRYGLDSWSLENSSRCFVHLANSVVWWGIIGEEPPTMPISAREYERRGLPWFDYYSEAAPLGAGSGFEKVKSIRQVGHGPRNSSPRDNEVLTVGRKDAVRIDRDTKKRVVREWVDWKEEEFKPLGGPE